jgi:hypothetical protein
MQPLNQMPERADRERSLASSLDSAARSRNSLAIPAGRS